MNNQKPVHEVRLGTIKAAVWKNETDNRAHYSVTFVRFYKEGNQWKTTESFGRDDLLMLSKAADRAHSWIWEKIQERAVFSSLDRNSGQHEPKTANNSCA